MGPLGDIILTLNSYSSDVAAAFLAVGLVLVRILLKTYPVSGDAASEAALVRLCMSLGRVVTYSICWILVAFIPMVIFFRGRGPSGPEDFRIGAAAVKYAGILALSAVALFSWSRLSKKVSRLESKRPIND